MKSEEEQDQERNGNEKQLGPSPRPTFSKWNDSNFSIRWSGDQKTIVFVLRDHHWRNDKMVQFFLKVVHLQANKHWMESRSYV